MISRKQNRKMQNTTSTSMKVLGLAMLPSLVSAMVLVSGFASTAQAQVLTLNATIPDPNAPITIHRTRAFELFRAITGVPLAIDDARLAQMEALIAQGKERDAAKIATKDPLFYDVQLRDTAKKMSTRDETVRAPVTDFVATFVGVARDGLDARQLLTGNFTYQADPNKTMVNGTQTVRSEPRADLVVSNNHYADIESRRYSLYEVLTRVDGQLVTNNANAATEPMANPDPAGLITTRAFMQAHADAGTNRRLVEYSFRQFMCVSMEDWMDAGRPDDYVGRDVDRFPGGSNQKYQVTCKACHTQMDGFRQAFSYVDFVNGKIFLGTAVVGKMNRNSNEFPEGFPSVDNKWVNYATTGKNADQFGWRTEIRGQGMAEFGRAIAYSKGFSRCMTKRLFASICNRAATTGDEAVIRNIADQFEATYKLTDAAELVALSPACMGKK